MIAPVPPVVRRAAAHGALIAGVVVIAVTAAALAAALAAIGGTALPRAAVQRIAAMPESETSIAVRGPMSRAQVVRADAALGGLMRTTLGYYPFLVQRAEIGRALNLVSGRGSGDTSGAHTTVIVPEAADGVGGHATLVTGTWPGSPRPGQPVDVAVPETVARLLSLHVGDALASADSFTATPVALRVSGLFREDDPNSPYWALGGFGPTGFWISGDTTGYGPMVVDRAAFSGALLNLDSAAWLVRPDLSRIAGGDIKPLADGVAQLQSSITQSPALLSVTVTTSLPQSLDAASGDAWAARCALAVAATLSALLALAALVLAARLLLARRELEAATLRARGGTSGQLVLLNAAEALAGGLVAAVGGVYGGAVLGDVLAPSAMPRGAPGLAVWLAAGATALVSAAIMAGAAIGMTSPVSAWVRRGRWSTVPALARTGGDVAVVALAAVGVWQLREITLTSTTGGIDPVLVVAPALAVAGATLLLIRLVPLAARFGERWAAHRRGLIGTLVTWEVSRNPARFAGVALLSVLAVTCGTLALTMNASWHRSQTDQAAFGTGADARVDLLTASPGTAAAIAGASGVTAATPLVTTTQAGGTAVALDPATASALALRPDLSPVPIAALWRRIAATDQPGLRIPGRPARIAVTTGLKASFPPGTPDVPAGVEFTVADADGVVYQVAADSLPADGKPHVVSSLIDASSRALYPLRLIGITLTGSFTSAALSVSAAASTASASGPLVPFASGTAFGGWWRGTSASGGLSPDHAPCSVQVTMCTWPSTPTLNDVELAATAPASTVPGIATASFFRAKGLQVGDVVPVTFNGVDLTVSLVAQIGAFPTMGDSPVVVLDLATLQNAVMASGSLPLTVDEWLLRTRDGTAPRGLPGAAVVTSRDAVQTALLNDPLASPPQRTWYAVAVAAAVLAVLGGGVTVAAELRTRRRDTALLAALGVSRWQQLRGLCLERLALGAVASGLGLLLGAGLSTLLVAPMTPSAAGTAPVPSVLVTYQWPWSAALAVVGTAGPVVALALGTLRRPDAAAELRLAEAI